jgi:Fe-S oxidoreductase
VADLSGVPTYRPSTGLCYDPADSKYWDPKALEAEIERSFDLCHSCRMCFKYCDSFRDLFRFIDDGHDGDARRVTLDERSHVMAQCFQCKLCEVECPYTPRQGHEFQLDFPKLVHRYRAQKRRLAGQRLRDRILGDPDLSGRLARASLGTVNALNRVSASRYVMEKTLGLDRRKLLPEFAAHAFDGLPELRALVQAEPGGELVLFQTCFVQHNEPSIGLDALYVLQRCGVDVRVVRGLRCCGMPAWESGDLARLRAQANADLDLLLPFVERGAQVGVINPTCSMMLRQEWPELLEGADRDRAKRLAASVRDVCEYLWSIRNEARFCTEWKSKPTGALAYHAPCHLRAQRIGFKGRDLLRKLPDVQVHTVLECSGHDGTFAMKTEGFETSIRVGKKAFCGMKEAEARLWVSDCPLACVQFEQHAGQRPLHPITVLARALRGDPF